MLLLFFLLPIFLFASPSSSSSSFSSSSSSSSSFSRIFPGGKRGASTYAVAHAALYCSDVPFTFISKMYEFYSCLHDLACHCCLSSSLISASSSSSSSSSPSACHCHLPYHHNLLTFIKIVLLHPAETYVPDLAHHSVSAGDSFFFFSFFFFFLLLLLVLLLFVLLLLSLFRQLVSLFMFSRCARSYSKSLSTHTCI